MDAVYEALAEPDLSAGVGVSAIEGCRSWLLLANELSESVREAAEVASDLSVATADLAVVDEDLAPVD